MPRSELCAHRSKASSNSNAERMSSLLYGSTTSCMPSTTITAAESVLRYFSFLDGIFIPFAGYAVKNNYQLLCMDVLCIDITYGSMDQPDKVVVVVVVFFTLTDRASTIPSNTRGCQSGTWSAGQKKIRGTSTKLQ